MTEQQVCPTCGKKSKRDLRYHFIQYKSTYRGNEPVFREEPRLTFAEYKANWLKQARRDWRREFGPDIHPSHLESYEIATADSGVNWPQTEAEYDEWISDEYRMRKITTWDGETYLPHRYQGFCTQSCAVIFAAACVRAGMVLKKHA